MQGKPVAYCVNNLWTEPAPECIPIKKWPVAINVEKDMYHYNRQNSDSSTNEQQRQLFSWGETDDRQSSSSRQGAYGDGARRLPLINGIWPPQDQKANILAMGPQSTPGPRIMVKEEIDIAELRNKQLEELKRQRHTDTKGGKRRGNKKNKKRKNKNHPAVDENIPRETVLSLGHSEEGQALSVSFARPENKIQKPHHKRRHRGHHKNKHYGKKYKVVHPTVSSFIISRPSRVDTSGISPHHTKYQFGSHYNHLEELRRPPVEQVRGNKNDSDSSVDKYDTSCVELLYGRDIPMIAPLVQNAFVFRYETKKNKAYPFNSYMMVKYRCFSSYVFANAKAQALHCKEASWVGEVPRCIAGSGVD